jgi:hypothetical protein
MRKERQGRRIRPAALNEMADRPSEAADFCNNIGTKLT